MEATTNNATQTKQQCKMGCSEGSVMGSDVVYFEDKNMQTNYSFIYELLFPDQNPLFYYHTAQRNCKCNS